MNVTICDWLDFINPSMGSTWKSLQSITYIYNKKRALQCSGLSDCTLKYDVPFLPMNDGKT